MPMPEEYKDTKMTLLCNECLRETIIPWHIAGGKCSTCGSYNTTRINDKAEAEIQGG